MKLFQFNLPLIILFFCTLASTAVFANEQPAKASSADLTAVLYILRGTDADASGFIPAALKGIEKEIASLSGQKRLVLADTLIGTFNSAGRLAVKGFTPAFQQNSLENRGVVFEWIILGNNLEVGKEDSSFLLRQFSFNVQMPYVLRSTMPGGNEVPSITRYSKAEVTSINITVTDSQPTIIGKLTSDFENGEPFFVVLSLKHKAK